MPINNQPHANRHALKILALIKMRGMTLIELMVTLAIAAITLSLAVPSFKETIRNNRTTTIANQLIATLAFARSEAIKRGVQVTIKRAGATSRVWERGWDLFVDIDGNGTFLDDGDTTLCETDALGAAAEDCKLRVYPALSNGYTLRTGGNYADWMGYLATGMSTSGNSNLPNDTFSLCDDSADDSKSRAIVINNTGRYYTQTGTASCP